MGQEASLLWEGAALYWCAPQETRFGDNHLQGFDGWHNLVPRVIVVGYARQ